MRPGTKTITVLEEVLDLGGLGNRLAGRVPDSLAGTLVFTARRISGWASQTLAFRLDDGGFESDLDSPAELEPPTTPVEAASVAIDDAPPGCPFTVGADASEAGRVLVTVTAVVGA